MLKFPFLTHPGQTGVLLRGEAESINRWTQQWEWRQVLYFIGLIGLGAGLYGAAMGCWHAPKQAFFSALKLPMVILLTTLGNALLNGMLAPLLGLNLGFRQSLLAILSSFSIACVILGGFSPLIFFMVWNTPALTASTAVSSPHYSLLLLVETLVIAFAGIMANVRLVQLLERLSGSAVVARRVLFSWLAGNLFLGAQLSWVLRPFIGVGRGEIHFFSPTPFDGNFYEAIYRAACALIR
jgi:hypothetical protein